MFLFILFPFIQALFLIFFFVKPLKIHVFFKYIVGAILTVSSFKIFAYLFIEDASIMDLKLSKETAFIVDSAFFTSVFVFIFTLLRSIINVIAKVFCFNPKKYLISPYSKRMAIVLVVMAALTGLRALTNAFEAPDETNYTIKIDKLKSRYKGFKIVQLSDLHICASTTEDEIISIVDRVNALNPDVVVITGDFVDGQVLELSVKARHLFNLKSTFGTFGVSGNHEFYSGYSSWMEFLEDGGIRMLENDSVTLRNFRGRPILNIAGISDLSSLNPHLNVKIKEKEKTDFEKAFRKVDFSYPVILLSHQPSAALKVKELSDLTISGHTHGGLAPVLKSIVKSKNSGFVSGLYEIGKEKLIVSNGTRIWAGVPLRLDTPAEINVITLE